MDAQPANSRRNAGKTSAKGVSGNVHRRAQPHHSSHGSDGHGRHLLLPSRRSKYPDQAIAGAARPQMRWRVRPAEGDCASLATVASDKSPLEYSKMGISSREQGGATDFRLALQPSLRANAARVLT